MLKFATILIQLILSLTLLAQDERGYLTLIESRIRRLQPHGEILYSDKLPGKIIGQNVEILTKNEINQSIKNQKYASLALTRAEVSAIKSQIQSTISYSWRDSIFTNSKVISIESIGRIVRSFNKSIRDSVINIPIAKRADPGILKWEFYFSKPIYLRDGDFLFYFFMYYRGSSGSHGFYLSQLKDGIWDQGARIGGGDW